MTRKQFLKTAGIGGAALITAPTILHQSQSIMKGKHDYSQAFGMARSLTTEHSYQPDIEGNIPKEIQGTLYRNGPGLFERQGVRKKNILDGDGMVQAFHFNNGKVKYLNRFVRTNKWLEEENADKYLFNTWTTRRPGGALKNAFLQGEFRGQAGVTVRVFNGKLYAFGESSLPYELDPETLETLNKEVDFGIQFENVNTLFAAHNKIDGHTGDWIQFGLENGPKANIQLSIFDPSGQLKRHKRYQLPLGTYMHDFFVSENYIIFNLQPAEMNPLSFIMGLESYAESLRWKNKKGSTFMVLHKSLQQKPVYLTTDAVWMWHSLNAFEKNGEIFCYFCGYDEPDHFIGNHAQTYEIMKPNATPGNIPATRNPGAVRIVRIDLNRKKITMEKISDTYLSYEFPVMNEQFTTYEHDIGYFASGKMNGAFHHQISRLNILSGKAEHYDFGPGKYCGEPVFVPNPNVTYTMGNSSESGWLMTLVFDENTDKSFIAILNTEALEDGPVAQVHLKHHSPMSFHGSWHSRS